MTEFKNILNMADKKDEKGNEDNGQNGNGSNSKNEPDFDWSKILKPIFSWGAIILIFIIAFHFMNNSKDEPSEIPYYQYLQLLEEGKIIKAKIIKTDINDYVLEGELSEAVSVPGVTEKPITKFTTVLADAAIEKDMLVWKEKGIKYEFEKKSDQWMNLIYGFLPWVLIIGFWIFFMKRMQGGGGNSKGIFNFGKSRAKLINESNIKITFRDVAGADEAKVELEEIIEFLKEPSKFQRLGGKIPRGVLLLGPPGTGKTLLARAVAGEAGVPFFSISGADFVEMFVGVGASRVRDLFEQGKKSAPCIIFIDEIDAVGRHRGAGLGGGHDEREQTLNQLLVEMDGFEQNSGVIIIAATNRPDVLDPALLRPGRFDRQIVVDRPDVKGREGILKVHTRKIQMDASVDILVLAKGTPGLAGAELANLVNEAALLAARKNRPKVTMEDFEEAKDKVMMGMERKSMIISEKEKKVTAYHEIGHVLVARKLPEADPVHKVTIIPRGRALGVTHYLPVDEKHTYSKEYIESTITYAMGGRAAELIVFGQLTTGAQNDIERSTSLARKMVCEWGMSEKLGPMAYGTKEEELFLGREITKHKEFSEQTAQEIDQEVKLIINKCYAKAEQILRDNIDLLHKLSTVLLEREIMDGEEIDKICKGEELPPVKKKEQQPVEEDIPDHVKKLMDEKMNRNTSETNE